MQEFWVNNKDGMPYFYVTGNVNEKLQFAIVNEIIPKLINDIPCKYSDEELEADKDIPRFTLVFDREAYSPVLFRQLWDDYRISVLTYKKNVNDLWDVDDFESHKITIEGVDTQMLLAEKNSSCQWSGIKRGQKEKSKWKPNNYRYNQ